MIKKFVTILFFCFAALFVQAQSETDEQLAKQFFDNREFDKSAILFEKLFNQAPLQEYFDGYLESVLALNDYKTAEKFIKKQIKRNPGNLSLAVHLGNVYKLTGAADKAKKQFNEAIENLQADQGAVIALSQTFNKYKEIDYVIKTLATGKKILRGIYPFNMELADAYNAKGDYLSMYKEYLEVLAMNEAYLGQIQNILQSFIGDEFKGAKADELRIQLLKHIQQFPDKPVYSEFLIWFFIQQRDFESAFIQAKALDKRNSQNIGKVINLAQICVSNQEYDVAIKCFEYEVQKGQSYPYYSYARAELVNTIQKKITETSNFSKNDLLDLEQTYNSALSDMGYNAQSISLIRGLAHLKGFFLGDPLKAIELLETALAFTNANPVLLAECKLELGDIYIFTGEMWEPALLYGQVDKGFKHDAIGQEAKFKNARLSFYKGEFEWAQAQLDVLKGATSKLIANDALALSLLISDNTVDSNYVPLAMFSRADLLSFQNKDSLALLALDSINKEFPGHSLSDDILFKKYKIDYKAAKYQMASEKLDQLILNYSDDILGDDAVFKLAELYEKNLNDLEKAKKLYQDVLLNYPGSLYTVEARKRYRKMRGDGLN
jgi:hypothetical protein